MTGARATRCFGYVRVSKERDGMVSPEVQQDAIAAHCALRGYTLLETFTDIDFSGKLPPEKRPALRSLLARAQAHECDVVVLYRIDRLSRIPAHHYAILAVLEDAGVGIDAATQPRDDSPESALMWDLNAVLASYESLKLGARLKDVHRRLAHTGRWHGGCVPYGFERAPDGLMVDEAEAAWVRWIHARYQEGWGIQRLCRALNHAGVRGRNGGIWETRQLQGALDAPTMVGATRDADGSLVFGGNIEPLLPLEVWERTQRLRAARSVAKPDGRPGVRLLSARQVRCASCGGWCYVHYQRGTPIYRCRTNRVDTCEQPTWLRVAIVEDYVVERLLRRLSGHRAPAKTKPRPDLAPLATTVERLRESLTTLAVMASEGAIGLDEFTLARERQQERLRAAERQLEQGVKRVESGESEDARRRALVALEGIDRERWETLALEDRRGVVGLLVASVTVGRAEPRIRVEWA